MGIKLLPKKIIGQTIRGVRTRLGMSPADFAKSLGVENAAEVGKWERGTTQPDYGTLAKIAAMGVVDALVFQEPQADGPLPQLTPGEAAELNTILARMEALLADARRVVSRATNRTAVELLEAATGSPPAQSVESSSLLLDAEVRLETTPRTRSRTASAGRRAAGTQTRTRTPRGSGSTDGSSGSSGGASGSKARSGSRSSSSRSKSGSSSGNSSPGGSVGGTTGASS